MCTASHNLNWIDYLIHSPHPVTALLPFWLVRTCTLTPILVKDTHPTISHPRHCPTSLPEVSILRALLSPLYLTLSPPLSISTSHSSLRQTASLASHPPYKPTRFPSQLQTRPVAAQLDRPLTTRHANSVYTTIPAIPRHRPAQSSSALPTLPRRCCCEIARALCWQPPGSQRPTRSICLCLLRRVSRLFGEACSYLPAHTKHLSSSLLLLSLPAVVKNIATSTRNTSRSVHALTNAATNSLFQHQHTRINSRTETPSLAGQAHHITNTSQHQPWRKSSPS